MSELPAAARKRLRALVKHAASMAKTFVGYPCRGVFDYREVHPLLRHPVNNVGDPFVPSTYRVNTKEIECEVLAWFAELTHAEAGSYWGYVTHGGSEGNMYGLYLARELYPTGMVYYCEETHYSVSKNLRLLRMPSIMIRSLPGGEIDYDDLAATLRIHRDLTPIIFANVGTTMKEGVDDISHIRAILRSLAIPQYYIHVDAALSGMTLPFISGAPVWDFRAGIDSLSISGHKFIGSPIPCGIALAKKSNVDRIARSIEYIGTLDTTISGSRNAVAPVYLWCAIQKHGRDGFKGHVEECLATARYAVDRMQAGGIAAWRNPLAITVVFPRPPEAVMEKWQIAVKDEHAHIICMPHVTAAMVDELVEDLRAAAAKPGA